MKRIFLAVITIILVAIIGITLAVMKIISTEAAVSVIVPVTIVALIMSTTHARGGITNQCGQSYIKPGPYVLFGVFSGVIGFLMFAFIAFMTFITEEDSLGIIAALCAFALAFMVSSVYLYFSYKRCRIYYDENMIKYDKICQDKR